MFQEKGRKEAHLGRLFSQGSWLEKQQKSNNKEATLGCEVWPCPRSPPWTARGKQAGQGAQQRSPCCHLNCSRNNLPLKLEQKTLDLSIYPTSSPLPQKSSICQRITRHNETQSVPLYTSPGTQAFLSLPSRSGGLPSASTRYWPSCYLSCLWVLVSPFVKHLGETSDL